MRWIALKMLMGDRAKYIGILVGITFASLLITQQSAIFVGLMARTYGFITDTSEPDIWVMDSNVEHIDDTKAMSSNELYRVRSVPGVEWAVPLYKSRQRVSLVDGNKQQVWLIGLDDETLLGGPPRMIEGELSDLRQRDGVIVDITDANRKLLITEPDGSERPLRVGDIIEINDNYATVVGLAENSRIFFPLPVLYTTYQRALEYAPVTRNMLSYVLVKGEPGVNLKALSRRISERTGLAAYTSQQFKDRVYDYYFEKTGIPTNFGIAVLLGLFVGVLIAGQTFYNFTLDNLRFFATFKAMGASNHMISRMVLTQAFTVGFMGYGFGVGLAALSGIFLQGTELSFKLTWGILGVTGGAVLLICVVSSFMSLWRVRFLEPGMVFQT